MKRDAIIPAVAGIIPLVLISVVLGGASAMQQATGAVLPIGFRLALFVLWLLVALGYVTQVQLFKRFGGTLVFLVALVILAGMLLPKARVDAYPVQASERIAEDFNAVWTTLYRGDWFQGAGLKDYFLSYIRGLGRVDPFRNGKLVLFGAMGFAMGLCFLFPVSPQDRRAYARQWALLFLGGVVYAFQMELLQVVSPTREVKLSGVLDCALGLFGGLILFVPAQWLYLRKVEGRAHLSDRFNVLGVGIDAVDMTECLRRFERWIGHPPARPVMATALGVAGIISARRDPVLRRILNASALNTPDGMPLVWLGRWHGYRRIRRVYGPDLLRDVCAYSADKGWTHFFYGAAPGVADLLKKKLEEKHPGIRIVGTYCPPFRPLTSEEEAELVEQVRRARPDIFWIGFSTPRQLYFMGEMRDKLDCAILCPVGYAFDVNAGVQQDAPDWIKYSGFQWVHRALKQPRLWKRYLPDNPRFVVSVLAQLLRLKKFPMDEGGGIEYTVDREASASNGKRM